MGQGLTLSPSLMIAFVVVLIDTGLVTILTAGAMFPRAGDVSGITAVTFRFSRGRTIVTTTAVGSAVPSTRASLGTGPCAAASACLRLWCWPGRFLRLL